MDTLNHRHAMLLTADDPGDDRQRGALEAMLNARERRLIFAGPFNAGKSELINTMTSRSVLPVDGVPETGVTFVLRGGEADVGRAWDAQGNAVPVACDARALAAAYSVYAPDGMRRAVEALPVQIELELARTSIPPGSAWLDSAGINDTATMTERALVAAMEGDILIWVLSSRQCLSMPEVEVLRRFTARRGTEALAFVLNVFLDEDTPAAWDAFLRDALPTHLRRIAELAPDLGFAAPPAVQVVSARAARQGGFGGEAVRRWLQGLGDPATPDVALSRQRRAERTVSTFRAALDERMADEAEHLRAVEAAADRAAKQVAQRERCRSLIADCVRKHISRFRERVWEEGKSLYNGIGAGSLRRDGSHETALNEALDAIDPASALCDAIDGILQQCGFPSLPAAARGSIRANLALPHVEVVVANGPMRGIGWKTVAAGAALVALSGPLGLLLLAGPSVAMSRAAKAGADVAATLAGIEATMDTLGADIEGMADDVFSVIDDRGLPPALSAPAPDPEALVRLSDRDDGWRRFLDVACPDLTPSWRTVA